jgi:hypothetical protein
MSDVQAGESLRLVTVQMMLEARWFAAWRCPRTAAIIRRFTR